MCRLIAMFADRETPAAGPLVLDPHALLAQSSQDGRGERHPDGWGIGWYASGRPMIVRNTLPAAEDPKFAATARNCHSRIVLGHVRQASVGSTTLANTHPFALGPWMFCHNGTITGFATLEQELAAETSPELLIHRRGSTDSELGFLWLLTRLLPPDGHDQALSEPLSAVAEKLAGLLPELDERCRKAEPAETPRLNFVLTDGHALLATRWNHSLNWQLRELAGGGRAVLLASEPTTDDAWREIPDHSILAADRDLSVQLFSA